MRTGRPNTWKHAVTRRSPGIDLLDNHIVSNDQLVVSSQYLPGSTIGKHLRHSRDHFELLLDAVKSPPPHVLSYDVRIRNTPMEQDREAARAALLETIKHLEEVVPGADPDAPIKLQAVTPFLQEFNTSFGRELWFAGLHCVHHWSMVRVIAGELNIKLADDFGFAPSTLVYQGRDAAPLGKAKI
ncbi:DinB-2 domain-containing protein [Mycena venus]|uniref:DinB-2 domain-containing protein n=1 Tax=Mycena venus TaxID=2733690 RepID=A0A8H7CJL7_9AGAR|nr:DinB-2 domain-containing protein [Mycena venus]